jgi:DNA repair photolyase
MRGRGTQSNPTNRFDQLSLVPDPGEPAVQATTQPLADHARSIISYNDSPDVGFDASINPYRGCEHGCSYCYARPMHEYLGFSAGLDFETKILVKHNAPDLLRKALSSQSWKPQPLALSGATDAYQPLERKLQLSRRCLEVLLEFRNPVIIVTKNHLVTRDIDLLAQFASWQGVFVNLSINSLDTELSRKLEPRTSTPEVRLKALRDLSGAGIPCGVFVAPVIPGLNDHEIPNVLNAAARAGAGHATYIMLRLPHGVKALFREWLEKQVPNQAEKVLHRIESVRDGRLNEASFGRRMTGSGPFAQQVQSLFRLWADKTGLSRQGPSLSTGHFRRALDAHQVDIFEAG